MTFCRGHRASERTATATAAAPPWTQPAAAGRTGGWAAGRSTTPSTSSSATSSPLTDLAQSLGRRSPRAYAKPQPPHDMGRPSPVPTLTVRRIWVTRPPQLESCLAEFILYTFKIKFKFILIYFHLIFLKKIWLHDSNKYAKFTLFSFIKFMSWPQLINHLINVWLNFIERIEIF